MGTRGLWNLHFDGKWYRFHDKKTRIGSPDQRRTVDRIKSILFSLDNLTEWELVAFPSPLQSNLDYVYTIDADAGILLITRWENIGGLFRPFLRRISLCCLDELYKLVLDSLAEVPGETFEVQDDKVAVPLSLPAGLARLDIRPGRPTMLNELQFRLYLDFCFVWRPFIDDPTTWCYPSMSFNTVVIALLRIAAWDLEVSSDTQIDYPINGVNFPWWQAPEADIFWFHGYLVVLHGTINTIASISLAISKAKSFLKNIRKVSGHLIILSLGHVAFVEISSTSVLCSQILPLIVNTSAVLCSPGFRLLCYVLSSDCWKSSLAHREQLGICLPPEILDLILGSCTPRDALTLSKASFIFQERYYSTIPQMPHTSVRSFRHSVACCGKIGNFQQHWVYCPRCYMSQHPECVGLKSMPRPDSWVICSDCKDGQLCTKLVPGGINHTSRRHSGEGCEVAVAGSLKVLKMRLSKPSHLRPELRLLGNVTDIHPFLISFTIRFNGIYAGLAYGLDDSY